MSRTWTAGEPPTDLDTLMEAVEVMMGGAFAEALEDAWGELIDDATWAGSMVERVFDEY